MRKREPGKIVAVWSRISHRALSARVRFGELRGASVTCSSAVGDADVAGGGEQLVQERPALLVGANVVRAQ